MNWNLNASLDSVVRSKIFDLYQCKCNKYVQFSWTKTGMSAVILFLLPLIGQFLTERPLNGGLFTDSYSLGLAIHQDSVLALVNKLKRYSIG